jgi:hypothetical protein
MAAKTTLTVTLPNGTKATRTTARAYTHVLAVREGQRWAARTWHGSAELALATTRSYPLAGLLAAGDKDEYRVIPVDGSNDTAPAEVAADGKCSNTRPVPGSYNPRKVTPRGTCADCGAKDVAMTKTMKLRKHEKA